MQLNSGKDCCYTKQHEYISESLCSTKEAGYKCANPLYVVQVELVFPCEGSANRVEFIDRAGENF